LHNIVSSKTKQRINTCIEEWKDKGLLTGYFEMLAKNIYSRTRVNNSEILELLIYSAYIEEQCKVEESELNIFKNVANFYYKEGQEEVNKTLSKKKKVSVIPDTIFFALLDMPNSKGYIWKQYIEAIVKYNADQIYRQCIINIQQNKENDIGEDIFQNIIKKQQNAKLCINGDKISGAVDNQLIGMNNLAKIEGIAKFDDMAKVKFVSIPDEKRTKMCASLEGQEFFVHDWNEFFRYSKTNDSIVKYRCYGLIIGLNCPPIIDGFHFCRSSIIYLPPIEKVDKIEYNKLEIPKLNKDIQPLLKDYKFNNKIKRLFYKYLTNENVIIDNNNNKPMYYSIDKDKIIINPKHKDFSKYDLSESLTHEIIHLIDIRNNISKNLNIDNELRRTRLSIDIEEDKYVDMLKSSKYEDNMTLGDIFSAITNGKITGNYGHESKYWLDDITRVDKEISANIMSAYLTNNENTLDIIDSIDGLRKIKEKVVNKYNDYTR